MTCPRGSHLHLVWFPYPPFSRSLMSDVFPYPPFSRSLWFGFTQEEKKKKEKGYVPLPFLSYPSSLSLFFLSLLPTLVVGKANRAKSYKLKLRGFPKSSAVSEIKVVSKSLLFLLFLRLRCDFEKMGQMKETLAQILILVSAVIGIFNALLQRYFVSMIRVSTDVKQSSNNGYKASLIEDEEGSIDDYEVVAKCAEIQNAITVGATSFLFTKYKYLSVFMAVFTAIIFLVLGFVKGFSTKSEPCTYNKDKLCKLALVNATFTTLALLPEDDP